MDCDNYYTDAALGITRPKGRVRIETLLHKADHRLPLASPGRKAGCGLKPLRRMVRRHRDLASPGRKAGCGLKQGQVADLRARRVGITRPKGRVRIETGPS